MSTNSSCFKVKKQLLVDGYFRKYVDNQYESIFSNQSKFLIVPLSIKHLIATFIPFKIPYNGYFTNDFIGKSLKIISDTEVQLNDRMYISSARMSVGIQASDPNVYYWGWIIHADSIYNSYHFLGFVTNELLMKKNTFDRTPCDGLQFAYGISGGGTYVYRGKAKEMDQKYRETFGNHEIIAVEFNGMTKKVVFKKHLLNKVIYEMQLPTEAENPAIHTWYPLISLANMKNRCLIVKIDIKSNRM